jgi:parallel beta-helix repeat protein
MNQGGAIARVVLVLSCAIAWAPTAAIAARITVSPGGSIQAAVNSASPGDTIIVMPGDYTENNPGPAAVTINKPLKLIAKSKPPGVRVRILPYPGQNQQHGILVEPANSGDPDLSGVRIRGFTVEGFPHMGIWLQHVKHFTLYGNESISNLENGIYPTLSAKGLVKKNVSYGSQDSAMWVEGSQNVRVIDNELSNSPTGLEVTVSHNITMMRNDVHNNTIGIGLYHPAAAGLPPLQPLSMNGDWHVIDNYVHDNNAVNTGPPGSETSQLPSGGGILVLGSDHVDVQRNRIENNEFFGIAMIDYCIATAGTPYDCTISPPAVSDTAPDYDSFIDNHLTNNHLDPPPGPFQPFAADILGLGGTNNCSSGNTFAPSPGVVIFSPALPGC